MKTYIKIILIAIVAVTITGLATGVALQYKTIRQNDKTIEFQRETIDSLLALPPAESVTLEVELHVTDKSKIDVNGKGNSGTINVPTDRKYFIEIDSTSLGITRKNDDK